MTNEEAKTILLKNRPERPRKTEDRQLQVAIDTAISVMDAYKTLVNAMHTNVR